LDADMNFLLVRLRWAGHFREGKSIGVDWRGVGQLQFWHVIEVGNERM
jgi:hypothetical protein